MATLYITEFARQGRDAAGYLHGGGAAEQPPVAEQMVPIGASSAESNAFNDATAIVRLHADSVCSVEISASPTATTANMRLAANQVEHFVVPQGQKYKVAAITNT